MYLSKLEIKNFKSFEHVTFDFTPKINVFTGVNNAGTTTVLEAIALWHECYKKLVRQAGTTVRTQFKKGDYILGTTSPTYIMDKDDMSDGQRLRLIKGFTDNLKLKTLVWDSYNFESVLLSDLDKLAKLLLDYILVHSALSIKPNLSTVQKRLQAAVEVAIETLKSIYEKEEELNAIWGKWKSRRELFTNKQLGINLLNIFEEDKDLKMNLLNYYRTCFNIQDFHKICRKEQTEKIIQSVLEPEGLDFALDKNFDALFALMKDVFNKYEFVLSI